MQTDAGWYLLATQASQISKLRASERPSLKAVAATEMKPEVIHLPPHAHSHICINTPTHTSFMRTHAWIPPHIYKLCAYTCIHTTLPHTPMLPHIQASCTHMHGYPHTHTGFMHTYVWIHTHTRFMHTQAWIYHTHKLFVSFLITWTTSALNLNEHIKMALRKCLAPNQSPKVSVLRPACEFSSSLSSAWYNGQWVHSGLEGSKWKRARLLAELPVREDKDEGWS